MLPPDRPAYEAAVAAVGAVLGEAAFAAAWAAGAALPLADAIGEATALTTEAGRADKGIAAALFISPRTGRRHVGAIFSKLGVDSRAASARAVRGGLS